MKQNKKIIIDGSRRSLLKNIYKRIDRGKSSLIIGEIGFGKTFLLEQIRPEKVKISNVESLGSLNYILASILRQQQYRFTSKKNKSVEYLEAICGIKKIMITIDDVTDLRSGIFRYIKRMMEKQIPVIMTGTPEIQTSLRERHEDVFCRLKIFNLQPIGINEIKKQYPLFDNDTLEVIFGFSEGNMWIFREFCEECIDEMRKQKLKKVTMDIVEKYI